MSLCTACRMQEIHIFAFFLDETLWFVHLMKLQPGDGQCSLARRWEICFKLSCNSAKNRDLPALWLPLSITQVMDLLEGLRCSALPLLCEHIIEVSFRNWLVAPALQKDGGYCVRKAPILHEDQRDETSDETDKGDFKVTPAHLFMFLSTPFSWKFCWLYFRRGNISREAPSLREYSLHCQTSS